MKNNVLSIFLDKEETRRKKKKKRAIINISIIAAIIIFGCIAIVLSGNDEGFAVQFIDSPTPGMQNIPTPTVTPIPTITPNPTLQIAINEAAPSLTPNITPTPYIHPGIRDGKFTEGEVIIDELSYRSEDLSIEIEIIERGENVMYIAEIYFASLDNLKPVFANGEFHNGYQTASEMADEKKAIFAVNSDSASAIDYGIIVRDQIVYRDILAADHMAIFTDGSMKTYFPENIGAEVLINKGAVHIFCFGPRLLINGKAVEKFNYSHIRPPHPRTAVGMIEPYHYYFVVVDGRSSYSKGMTLEELSKVMKELGCISAYNLDGGGSSTMIFMGELINKPLGKQIQDDIDSAILFIETPEDSD